MARGYGNYSFAGFIPSLTGFLLSQSRTLVATLQQGSWGGMCDHVLQGIALAKHNVRLIICVRWRNPAILILDEAIYLG